MKTIIIVCNNTTTQTYTYNWADLTKARIAVDYLTHTTPYLWYIKHVQVEAYASTNFLAGQLLNQY